MRRKNPRHYSCDEGAVQIHTEHREEYDFLHCQVVPNPHKNDDTSREMVQNNVTRKAIRTARWRH
jgi:hypothetical protein